MTHLFDNYYFEIYQLTDKSYKIDIFTKNNVFIVSSSGKTKLIAFKNCLENLEYYIEKYIDNIIFNAK